MGAAARVGRTRTVKDVVGMSYILAGCIITHAGEVVNETIKKIIEGGA